MKPPQTKAAFLGLFLLGAVNARAQKWVTQEVVREMGYEMCTRCSIEGDGAKVYALGNGRITPVTLAYFDTVATYAQGRVVDVATGKPIRGAVVQARYTCREDCGLKTAITNDRGFFRLGWVGCSGPEGGRSNRPLLIRAANYQTVNTAAVAFGAAAYLHIELAQKRRKQ
ncbi:hypothetical protein JAO73_04475 [Hymenobacter sp. BT523]|uniref:hypothetical protein n=1 Tax=Hymenobacter sp. BT523 TaxID=2795725 RepID=UPI0018ECF7F6|nr:hypothetical protein [Hymenobacter sp. BT523]MBJ6108253.1 hypothetical protein [Hymenobacter sp. BT523]